MSNNLLSDFLPSGTILHEFLPDIQEQAGFLRSITEGYHLGAAFFTAYNEGLFNYLLNPRTISQISKKFGMPNEKITLFLGMLVSGKILGYSSGFYQIRTELIPFLDKKSPFHAQWLEYECINRNYWTDLDKYLKQPGEKCSEKSNSDLKKRDIVSMGMQSLLGRLQGIITELMNYPGFSSSRTLLDLGGGHGLIGIGIAQANPEMKVVIYDRPSVIRVAEEHTRLFGVEKQVTCIGGDYSTDLIGSGYDVILHICPSDYPPDTDREVIKTISNALTGRGIYVRCGFFLDENSTSPLLTTTFALAAEMRGDKRHRTIPEFKKMVNDSGLKLVKTIDMSPYCDVPMYMLISEHFS